MAKNVWRLLDTEEEKAKAREILEKFNGCRVSSARNILETVKNLLGDCSVIDAQNWSDSDVDEG